MTNKQTAVADPVTKPPAWRRLTNRLPTPPDVADQNDLLWQELAGYFEWYDRGATRNRLSYQSLKVAVLVTGAAVTVLAASGAPAALSASLAAAIVVLEGAQQLFQFHANWISYRATAETLRGNGFAYAARVSPYEDPATRRSQLAEFLRDITTSENSAWTKTMKDAAPKDGITST
jgi:hypothetical protein